MTLTYSDGTRAVRGVDLTVPRGDRAERIEELLDLVDLADVTDKRADGFSGGMRKRLWEYFRRIILDQDVMTVIEVSQFGATAVVMLRRATSADVQ